MLYRAPEWGHRMTAEELGEHIQAMGLAVEPSTANDAVRAAELIALSRAHRSDTTYSCSTPLTTTQPGGHLNSRTGNRG